MNVHFIGGSRHISRLEGADESPRNNVGGWPVRVIRPGHGRRDFDYCATKDRAIATVPRPVACL
jgi:hypothetical protein